MNQPKFIPKSTISNITYVQSDITRATNLDLVSFHRSHRLVLNETVLKNTGIDTGMYALVIDVDKNARHIKLLFSDVKLEGSYKVGDLSLNQANRYASMYTRYIIYTYGILCYGAFEYSYEHKSKIMTIKY